MPEFAAILLAAGKSTRFAPSSLGGLGRNKLLELLRKNTVFERSLWALWNHEFCDEIFIPAGDPEIVDLIRSQGEPITSDLHICAPGETRAHSVLSALREIPTKYEWVAIHDAARPLVSMSLIDRTLAAAVEHGAAAPALPMNLTVKQAKGPLPARVERTIPRADLWAMQTPQIVHREELLEAYKTCPIPLEQVTDDVQLLELAGKEVWLVPGDEQNLKITTYADLRLARASIG
jgi:2-C-methyl-D-erythritol 4-phosphate cytidylyltransferase